MWTGDIQSGYPTQWALNPSTYQNLPNEQVDWASLAQQWIKMKETYPEPQPQPQPQPQVPPAPPPPSIRADLEAGEAPMDVAKEDVPPNSSTNSSQDGNSWGAWGSWQQQWGWGWGGPPDTYTAPAVAPPTATFDYNHGASMPPENFEQDQQPGYWSAGPAPFVRNKAAADWRPDRPPSRRPPGKVEEVEPDTTTLFDAAKRKQLPAWIREGLEKMEREKQKKLERERQLKEREEEMMRRKQEEEEALASGVPLKSKFDTDSEESDKETEAEVAVKSQRPRVSRFDSTSSPATPKAAVPHSYSPPPVKRKSREEIMQEVMQQVRYVLTDILMTVTNEEMQKIAEEVLADFRAKAPATRLRQTPAFTSLTGKLGLGIYDSDSEDSSSESDDRPSLEQENGLDSDEELRERINRKKQEFARIERDIEHQVEQQEERERERQVEEEDEEEEEEEEKQEQGKEMGQVEPKLYQPGNKVEVKPEEHKPNVAVEYEQNDVQSYTPERLQKVKESSDERSEYSSSSRSDSSSSRSSSSSRHKRSRKSSKRKKEKKSKRKRKRSRSRSGDRRRSHKKSSHSHRYDRSRSRSRSRDHYDDYRHYRRHSSESSHKRRHHSYSGSPDHSRGKRSSHRSRD